MRRVFVLLAISGCFGGQTYPQVSSGAPSGAYTSSFSKSGKGVTVNAPTGALSGVSALIVKPDLLQVNFAFKRRGVDRKGDLAKLKTLVEKLGTALGNVAEIKVVPCDLKIAKRSKLDKEAEVIIDGRIAVPLKPEMDFWARAALLSGVQAVFERFLQDAEKDESLTLGFSASRALVRAPEAHRAALGRQWAAKLRIFSKEAESEAHPLHPLGCTPPKQIDQRTISLTEVALSLPINCRLDVVKP